MSNYETVFSSFFWAGFECTYALAEHGLRFDLLAASLHDSRCKEDYQMLRPYNLMTVREGLSWNAIDQGNKVYDFSRFEPMMRIAKEEKIQQIWDLNHFDFPVDVDPFSSAFIIRFREYAKQCISIIRRYQEGRIFIVPLNEPSFFAWMCDNGLWAPYAKGKGTEFKRQLVRASIAAMEAIWSIDKNVSFIHADPYMYRQPLRIHNKEEQLFCQNFNEHVKFHSWDMLCGRDSPELGGDPKYLQYVGMNYYFYNQQFVGIKNPDRFIFKSIPLTDKKRLPLFQIIEEIINRYHVPVVITETGSYRNRRPIWWKYILSEIEQAQKNGVLIPGVCAYPVLDIPPGAGFIIPKSGLWDFKEGDKTYTRIPELETLSLFQSTC